MLDRGFVDFGYLGTHYLPGSNLPDLGSVKYMSSNGTGRAGYLMVADHALATALARNRSTSDKNGA